MVTAIGGTGTALEDDLDRFSGMARQWVGTERTWVLVIRPDAPIKHVTAVAWLQVVAGSGIRDAHDYWLASTGDGNDQLLSRRVVEVSIGGKSGVVLHDLVGSASDPLGGAVLLERVAVVIHHPAQAVNVLFELSTSDLTAFDDIVVVASTVLSKVVFGAREEAQHA